MTAAAAGPDAAMATEAAATRVAGLMPPSVADAPGSGAALWACAGLIVLAAHVGGALWLLHAPAVVPADDMPPAAIMIDLADTPEATATEETEISPDLVSTEASHAAQQMKGAEAPIPEQTTQAVEEVSEVTEPLAPETPLPVIEQAEVTLPVAKPKPAEPKPPEPERPKERKPVQRRQEASTASAQAVRAQAQVTPSERNAARQTASGLMSTPTPAAWNARLMAHLERRKKYPPAARSRRESGTVFVRFSLDESGNVLTVALARSSGFPDLDAEVLALVRRASPVPPPPADANRTITAPVRFRVN
ncbi:biopolymer transporter TonB [Azorhizobium oxalatiphilum]|uniref:Biopolymer transporter TonB n=1 Tax=Azorhizobium oxalatiphilum TaxID=980631 RepID=A0A917FC41_9HYPH|nr:energy transducer TonB [Azorhizobium oxalatiphilum]GGF63861.1 biopolymer transporter TonB [Azorhizobium oxalatiphilum]